MGILKDKSGTSLSAADVLIKGGIFPPSVHCSYYSCLQLLLDIIHEDLAIDEDELDYKYENENDHGHKLHNFYINLIYKVLDDKIAFDETTEEDVDKFYEDIMKIKGKRVDADYKRKQIGGKESSKVFVIAKSINEYLNSIDFSK